MKLPSCLAEVQKKRLIPSGSFLHSPEFFFFNDTAQTPALSPSLMCRASLTRPSSERRQQLPTPITHMRGNERLYVECSHEGYGVEFIYITVLFAYIEVIYVGV